MGVLTYETLTKMLSECEQYENYVAAVLFESKSRELEFLNTIKSAGNDWSVNVRAGRIKFKNSNSHIYTFIVNKNFEDKIRGMMFNSILIDGAKGADDVVAYIYGQSLVKYMDTQSIEDMAGENCADEALVNFLDEFAITGNMTAEK